MLVATLKGSIGPWRLALHALLGNGLGTAAIHLSNQLLQRGGLAANTLIITPTLTESNNMVPSTYQHTPVTGRSIPSPEKPNTVAARTNTVLQTLCHKAAQDNGRETTQNENSARQSRVDMWDGSPGQIHMFGEEVGSRVANNVETEEVSSSSS